VSVGGYNSGLDVIPLSGHHFDSRQGIVRLLFSRSPDVDENDYRQTIVFLRCFRLRLLPKRVSGIHEIAGGIVKGAHPREDPVSIQAWSLPHSQIFDPTRSISPETHLQNEMRSPELILAAHAARQQLSTW